MIEHLFDRVNPAPCTIAESAEARADGALRLAAHGPAAGAACDQV